RSASSPGGSKNQPAQPSGQGPDAAQRELGALRYAPGSHRGATAGRPQRLLLSPNPGHPMPRLPCAPTTSCRFFARHYVQDGITSKDATAVSHLSTGFRIQRAVVQDDFNLLAFPSRSDLFTIANEADDLGIRSQLFIAGKDGGLVIYPLAVQSLISMAVFFRALIRLSALALLRHRSIEGIHVNVESGFGSHLQRQVNREPVGVMQLESLITFNHGLAL